MAIFGEAKNKRIFTEPGFEFTMNVDIPANTVVSYGGLFGVTTEFTPAGKLGWAACQGTFELTATGYSALTYTKGDKVGVTVTDNIGTVDQAGTTLIGRAVLDKASGADNTTVTVMLIQTVS